MTEEEKAIVKTAVGLMLAAAMIVIAQNLDAMAVVG